MLSQFCSVGTTFYAEKISLFLLCRQIALDCTFLQSQKIIDYSLLLGLHFRAPEHLKLLVAPPDSSYNNENKPTVDGKQCC